MELLKDRRAQSMRSGVSLAVAVLVVAIMVAVTMPVALNNLSEPASTSFTGVSEGNTVDVAAGLNATLDNVTNSTSPSTINVTVTDTDTGSTSSVTNLDEGNSSTVTLEGEDINVTNDNVSDGSTADFTVAYPIGYGWGSGAKSMFDLIPLFLMLAIVIFFVGIAMRAKK